MDWSQWFILTVYVAGMLLAFWRGSIAPALALVVLGNFAGMVWADGDLRLMIAIDGLTLAALIYDQSEMASGLAYAFVASLVVEAMGERIGLPFNTTSAIVDAMIVPIAAIIGWSHGAGGKLDFGVGPGAWRGRGRRAGSAVPVAPWRHPGISLAQYPEAHRRGLR